MDNRQMLTGLRSLINFIRQALIQFTMFGIMTHTTPTLKTIN